ncbi:MAG: hypothetical protein KKE51_10180 [Gammaproteobacteria bacterium]|nr:hypothetical protein [Gammaproteobacteria bacterium]
MFISHDAERAEAAAEEPVALEGTNGVWEGNRQASLFNLMADEAPPPSIAREPEERITTNLPPSTRSRRRGSGRAWMLVLLAATLAAALVCAVLYFGD